MSVAARRGEILWTDFGTAAGHEQQGVGPALVIASEDYLTSVRRLVVVVPVTSIERDWPHRVEIRGEGTGLSRRSFAMTEQPRTVSTERLVRSSGFADARTVAEVDQWLRDFLGLG